MRDGLYLFGNKIIDLQIGYKYSFIWYNKNSKYNRIKNEILRLIVNNSEYIGEL